jgi:hypothetical protein
MRLSLPILVSIAVAAIAFILTPISFFLRFNTNAAILLLDADIWAAWIWVITFFVAVYINRWRALWLLLAAPFALIWPITTLVVGQNICHWYGRCILDGLIPVPGLRLPMAAGVC